MLGSYGGLCHETTVADPPADTTAAAGTTAFTAAAGYTKDLPLPKYILACGRTDGTPYDKSGVSGHNGAASASAFTDGNLSSLFGGTSGSGVTYGAADIAHE